MASCFRGSPQVADERDTAKKHAETRSASVPTRSASVPTRNAERSVPRHEPISVPTAWRPGCVSLGIEPDSRMKLGYNTNGLAHHRLVDAIELLADEGYQSVAITLDAGALDPYDDAETLSRQISQVRSALDRRGLSRVIETGARYLLNPRIKHDPTLMDPDPARRAVRSDFLLRAIDIAAAIGAEAVSLWSGCAPAAVGESEGLDRLAEGLRPLLGSCRASANSTGIRARAGHVHRYTRSICRAG